ncbi:MAG: signal peptidase II [Acetatifactor sp.]
MRKRNWIIIDLVIVFVLLALDQFTKQLAIEYLKDKPARVIIKNVFELNYLENHGSAFGMLQNQKFFLIFVGVLFMGIVLFFLLKLPENKKFYPVHVCLSAVIAGGIGNMIDRIRFDHVVDFFSFVLINFPIFNVADCYIVVAITILFILFIFVFKEEDLDFLSFKQNKYREMK